jgi:hypothetical protein
VWARFSWRAHTAHTARNLRHGHEKSPPKGRASI